MSMNQQPVLDRQVLAELSSAEAFLGYFEVSYDEQFLEGRRISYLRLLARLVDNLSEDASWQAYQVCVEKAYCLLQRGVNLALSVPDCGQCQQCDSSEESAEASALNTL